MLEIRSKRDLLKEGRDHLRENGIFSKKDATIFEKTGFELCEPYLLNLKIS